MLVTDKLASYGVAHRRLTPGVEHRKSKYLNNRVENSHQPTRARERAARKFRSPGGAQREVVPRVVEVEVAVPCSMPAWW